MLIKMLKKHKKKEFNNFFFFPPIALFRFGGKMCFKKKDKPVRLEKKTSSMDDLKFILSITDVKIIIVFIIIFIIFILIAMQSKNYYFYNGAINSTI